jgi:hypothetical protein
MPFQACSFFMGGGFSKVRKNHKPSPSIIISVLSLHKKYKTEQVIRFVSILVFYMIILNLFLLSLA